MRAFVEGRGLQLAGRLAPLDIGLEESTLTCLIGPNGSGKTSLLQALAGIGGMRGSLEVGGTDPRSLGPDARRALVAYLPASRDIFWPLSVRDLVALGLGRGADRDGLQPLLERLDLDGLAGRRIDRLSTGERSRALIARALAADSRLLLLDEPTANLDPLWQLRLMNLAAEAARQPGRAAVVAVHDLDLAVRYADRLIVMERSGIVADGPASAIAAGGAIPQVFGVARGPGGWREVRPPAGPRSSR